MQIKRLKKRRSAFTLVLLLEESLKRIVSFQDRVKVYKEVFSNRLTVQSTTFKTEEIVSTIEDTVSMTEETVLMTEETVSLKEETARSFLVKLTYFRIIIQDSSIKNKPLLHIRAHLGAPFILV